MIRLLVIAALFLTSPALACLEHSLPEHGSETHINNNRVELEFDEVTDPKEVTATVTDEQGRKVSTGEIVRGDDNKTVYVVVRSQNSPAGFQHGQYVVQWNVNHGAVEHSGRFTFRVHKH
jgi:methionine-rich copper-binding protein CopC